MHYRPLLLLLIAGVTSACSTTNYKSPSPDSAAVASVRAQTETVVPDRTFLTVSEADAIARPIFDAISEDAVRICRTIAEADSCIAPAFEVEAGAYVNAYVKFDQQNRSTISLTRDLVEYLADQPGEIALVIGHQYGHLIAAHVEEDASKGEMADSVLSTTLSILSAVTIGAGSSGAYGRVSGPVYSQAEIDAYLANDNSLDPAYTIFSNSQELEADYIGTYLASRSGYQPTGNALIEIGALEIRDTESSMSKLDTSVPFSYWDTHPYSPKRVARIQETLEEIERLKAKGYARPIPPQMILDITDNNAAFHSLEELVAPLPREPQASEGALR